MNPGIDNTPGLGLPQPSPGMGQAPFVGVPSFGAPNVPGVPSTQQPMPSPAVAAPSQSFANPVIAQQQSVSPQPQDMPHDDTADDTALDEEWISKAKEAVERNRVDPYLQSRELSRLKAQYVKLRYDKDIKIGEEN